MDIMEFFKMMGLKNETCFKKSDNCFCVYASLRLKGDDDFDKIVGSSIPYVCDECFEKISEKDFEKKINDYEEIVMNLSKKKFMKNEEELNNYFLTNSLNKKKMEENSKKLNEKLNYIHLQSVDFDEKDLTLNLSNEPKNNK